MVFVSGWGQNGHIIFDRAKKDRNVNSTAQRLKYQANKASELYFELPVENKNFDKNLTFSERQSGSKRYSEKFKNEQQSITIRLLVT